MRTSGVATYSLELATCQTIQVMYVSPKQQAKPQVAGRAFALLARLPQPHRAHPQTRNWYRNKQQTTTNKQTSNRAAVLRNHRRPPKWPFSSSVVGHNLRHQEQPSCHRPSAVRLSTGRSRAVLQLRAQLHIHLSSSEIPPLGCCCCSYLLLLSTLGQ